VNHGSYPVRGKTFFFSSQPSDWLWGVISKGALAVSPDMQVITHLHVMPKLGMCGGVLTSQVCMCVAQCLKKRRYISSY
jgi:hypothetical protein